MDGRNALSIMAVSSCRGADHNSDHQLDRAKYQHRLLLLLFLLLLALSGVGLQLQNVFLAFASLVTSWKVFPFFLIIFHTCSSNFILGLPLHCVSLNLVSFTCVGFLFLSILISCPKHLSSLLSPTLVLVI